MRNRTLRLQRVAFAACVFLALRLRSGPVCGCSLYKRAAARWAKVFESECLRVRLRECSSPNTIPMSGAVMRIAIGLIQIQRETFSDKDEKAQGFWKSGSYR